MILRAVERSLDGVLLGMIGTETGAKQFLDPLRIRLYGRGVAADNAPSNAPSGRKIIFRDPTEGDSGDVGSNGSEGDVLVVVEDQLVVNLVGEDHQVVAASDLGDVFEHSACADGAGGIVGIDEHDPASVRRDLLLDVVEFGLPAVRFVKIVRVQIDAELGKNGRVQRIVGAGREQVVSRVQKRGEASVDALADTVGDKYIANGRDSLAGCLTSDGFQRFFHARRRSVAVLVVAHGLVDRFDHVRRSREVKDVRIADVEREDLVSLLGDFIGIPDEVADGVADVLQTSSGKDFTALGKRHRRAPKPKNTAERADYAEKRTLLPHFSVRNPFTCQEPSETEPRRAKG